MLTTRMKAAATLGLALAATVAVPATADIPTSLTIAYDNAASGFAGDVTSPNKHCLANRMVTITRFEGDAPTTIGTATTDATGHFTFPDASAQAGSYETTVAAKTVKGPKPKKHHKRKKYNCGAGTTGREDL